jgi:ketosteroid isomerase-like protein
VEEEFSEVRIELFRVRAYPHWEGPTRRVYRRGKERLYMSEQENRDALERLVRAFQERDVDALADLVHDDVVEEYPQSGERVRGKQNYLSVFENIPVMPNVIDYRFTLSGDLAIAERTVEYGGSHSYNTAITEMEDGKVKRARQYFATPFEASQWRAQWVERM